ncbi:MAG: hypothetical protein OJF51_002357 [Nitrospira sp.]|jgi:hypothetical protein|nr:MAG: hypothetical protein OJF51_002357 [Nitrospira sp.]
MEAGWLRQEIENVQREVRDWPEWKKGTASDDRLEVKETSLRESDDQHQQRT